MSEFTGMAEELDVFFDKTADIISNTSSYNTSDGSMSNSQATLKTSVPCAIEKVSDSQKYKGERLSADVVAVVMFKYSDVKDLTLTNSDKVTIDGIDYTFIDVENVINDNEFIDIPVRRFRDA